MIRGYPDPTKIERRWPYLARALRGAVLGALVGVGLALFLNQSIGYTMVYSICVSILCWFCIDLGRRSVARWLARHSRLSELNASNDWPGWAWMIPVLVVGTVIGFSGGTAIGDLLTHGHSANLIAPESRREALAFLLLSLAPAIALTYYYRSKGLIADKEAAAQRAELQAAESQLKLLESQLEPHMLFNTLANLRVLIGADPRRAQLMLDQLIAFLRATLSGSRASYHSLRTEFARIADYLSLMQVRMGPRLSTRFDLPEELSEASIPSLLLQPLVENSIKHGLEPNAAGGRIEVSAARDGGVLVLCVRDTGAGIAGVPSDAASFGLAQIRGRLATLYGMEASLSLLPAGDAEGGTVALVRLPWSGPTTPMTEPRP